MLFMNKIGLRIATKACYILGVVNLTFSILLSMVSFPVAAEEWTMDSQAITGNCGEYSKDGIIVCESKVPYIVASSKQSSSVELDTKGDTDKYIIKAFQPFGHSGDVVLLDQDNSGSNCPVTPTPTTKFTPTKTLFTPTPQCPTPTTKFTQTNTPVTPTPNEPTPTPTNSFTSTNTPVTPTLTNTQVTPTPQDSTPTPDKPTATPTTTPEDPTWTPTPQNSSPTPDKPTATPTTTPEDPTVTPTTTPDDPTVTPTTTPDYPTATPTTTPDYPTATTTDTSEDPTMTPTNTPVTPTPQNTTTTPDVPTYTPENTKIPTLPSPDVILTPDVLIPVTGIDMSLVSSPYSAVRKISFNLGIGLIGFGMVLQGIRKRFES